MTIKEWVISLFSDERGAISIKPVVAFMGAVFLCVTMSADTYNKTDLKPSDSLVNAVMIITAIGLGADSVDKFSIKKSIDKVKAKEDTDDNA
jgi:hypothetical protein